MASGRLDELRHSTVFRGVATLVTGTGAAQLITFGGMLICARLYDDVAFGVLALVNSVVGILVILASLRYDQAVVLPTEDGKSKAVVRTAVLISLWFSALVMLVIACGTPLWKHFGVEGEGLFLLNFVGVLVLATALTSIWTFWLTRKERFRQIATNRIVNSSATLGAQIGAYFLGFVTGTGLVLGRVLGIIVSTFVLGWKARDSRVEVSPIPVKKVMYRYRKMPLLNGVGAMADSVRINGINMLLAAFFSTAVLGQFSLAWQVVQAPLVLISSSLSQVFFPILARTKPGDMLSTVRRLTFRAAVIGIVPFALLALLAPWLFTLFFGAKWFLAGQVAQILTPWLFLNLITSPISSIFLATETQQVVMPFSIVFAIVPLSWIAIAHGLGLELLVTLVVLSVVMAAMLLVFIVLAWAVARRFDRSKAKTDQTPQSTSDAEDSEDPPESDESFSNSTIEVVEFTPAEKPQGRES